MNSKNGLNNGVWSLSSTHEEYRQATELLLSLEVGAGTHTIRGL